MALAGNSTTPCPSGTGTSASLRTWRSGRLPAGSSAASLRGEASLVDTSASTRGLRAVRLSRINPTFPQMERLDEARHSCDSVEDPETAPSMLIQAPKQPPAATLPFQKGLVTTTDDLAEKQKWPLSLAARPAMWEGLDTQGLSATSGASRGTTNSRRVQGHLGLRRLPGQPLGPFERDKLLDSFNQFRQNGGHLPSMASSTSHFRGVDLLEHDTEALQQRCAELEALVMELKRTKRRSSKPNSTSSTVSLPGTPGGTCTPSTAPDQADLEDVAKFSSRAEQAEHRAEVLAAELAAASARLAEAEDGASAKVAAAAASLRASEAACLAAVEAAQDANEARRRVEEELLKETAAAKKASSDEMAEAAAAKAATEEARRVKAVARSRASEMHQMRAESQELALLATCFATWRLWLADNRISSAREVIDAQAKEIGRVASLQARQRVRHGIEAALKGTEIEVMHTVIAAWRTSLCTRRTVGSLQAALFAEEADRASALRAQRSECDVLLLQAEARHRIALQKLRTELAEAQAKQKEATAAERLALQAAVRAESIGWPSLDLPDTEDGATDHPSSPETE